MTREDWPVARAATARTPAPAAPRSGATAPLPARVRAAGKFLFAGEQKLYVRGATYGTFRGADGVPQPTVVAADFAAMAAAGINSVRIYTVPPRWLLDLAAERGLRVLVGIPWEQHVTFLDEPARARAIEARIREGIHACREHPAVLGYAVGNEIPAGIVRWHGRRRVERFIERLYRAAKAEDPAALVTYANYPSTEYLQLPFLDFVCCNVFLEDQPALKAYLARLQTIAGDRPLVIGELGLDSRRHGARAQAASIRAQVRTAYAAGCAGCFVFAWTDEWSRGGHDVEDWDFGLVDRAREPKPALDAAREAFAQVPFREQLRWPSVSVVVCTYNGARTIGDCVRGLRELDYPDYDTIVIDDGSSDGAGAVAESCGARVVRIENAGLSAARNAGIAATAGEIVAFCDDDCRPDPHWLRYLVSSLMGNGYAGVGGPNVPPADTVVADSVGHAPGRPVHVLSGDSVAEHIPGCNMAFRRSALDLVGGFDSRFRAAGDDVDICWRIQQAGGTLGFSPGALVWHRARRSVRAYVRQQAGYGRAEALLERKWPERYSGTGHVKWSATGYGGKPRRSPRGRRWLVYYGHAGSGLFQSIYQRGRGAGAPLPLAPEWYLLLAVLALGSLLDLGGSLLGLGGAPLPFTVLGIPVLAFALLACLAAMLARAAAWTAAVVLSPSTPAGRRARTRALVLALCLLQPLARLWGRTHHGLTPWRRRGPAVLAAPAARRASVWSERPGTAPEWVGRLESQLRESGAQVIRGGDTDTWDVQVRVGALAAARVRLAVEEHGHGRQLVRLRAWPRCSRRVALLELLLVGLAGGTALRATALAAAPFALGALWLSAAILVQAAAAVVLPVEAAARLQGSRRAAPERRWRGRTWAPAGGIHARPVVAMTLPEYEPWQERL